MAHPERDVHWDLDGMLHTLGWTKPMPTSSDGTSYRTIAMWAAGVEALAWMIRFVTPESAKRVKSVVTENRALLRIRASQRAQLRILMEAICMGVQGFLVPVHVDGQADVEPVLNIAPGQNLMSVPRVWFPDHMRHTRWGHLPRPPEQFGVPWHIMGEP